MLGYKRHTQAKFKQCQIRLAHLEIQEYISVEEMTGGDVEV